MTLRIALALIAFVWLTDARAFVPHKAPIVLGVYATLAACEQERRWKLEGNPGLRCVGVDAEETTDDSRQQHKGRHRRP
jgi:hypothetical protein